MPLWPARQWELLVLCSACLEVSSFSLGKCIHKTKTGGSRPGQKPPDPPGTGNTNPPGGTPQDTATRGPPQTAPRAPANPAQGHQQGRRPGGNQPPQERPPGSRPPRKPRATRGTNPGRENHPPGETPPEARPPRSPEPATHRGGGVMQPHGVIRSLPPLGKGAARPPTSGGDSPTALVSDAM